MRDVGYPHPEDVARLEMARACTAELQRLIDEMEAGQRASVGAITAALREAAQLRMWLREIADG